MGSSHSLWKDPWFNEYVPLDPLLLEPLDLWGERARRRHLALAVATALQVDQRLMMSEDAEARHLARLMLALVGPLASVVDHHRVSAEDRAAGIARSVVPQEAGAALTLLMAVGPGDEYLHGGHPGDVCRQVRRAFESRMEALLLRMLRRWMKAGYIESPSAAWARVSDTPTS